MLKIDAFTQGYIDAAFWTECEPGTTWHDHDPETQSALPGDASWGDLAPGQLEKMVKDCQRFQAENAEALEANTKDDTQAGHDFWLTRNHHGAGFWDGGWPEPQATLLTDAAHTFGECNLYMGDDGLIYLG